MIPNLVKLTLKKLLAESQTPGGTNAFVLQDLKKNRFFEYKSHKVAQRLRDIQGEATALKIKGNAIRVWRIPAFEYAPVEVSTPEFGDKRKTPW